MRARNWAGVTLGGVALAGAIALPMTANADDASPSSEGVRVASPAPVCIKHRLDDNGPTDELLVTNKCKRAWNVKVILERHTDLVCTRIAANRSKTFTWKWPGKFDGIARC